jgi:hypothetical protein
MSSLMQKDAQNPDALTSPVQLGLRLAKHNAEIIGLFAVVALLVTAPITVTSLVTAALAVAGAGAFGFAVGVGFGTLTRTKSLGSHSPRQQSAPKL